MNLSLYDETASNPTTTSADRGFDESVSGHSQDLPCSSIDQYGMHGDGGQGVMPASIQKPSHEDSVIKFGSLSFCRNRKARSRSSCCLNKHIHEDPLFYPSDKFIPPVARDADDGLAPGNMVWDKAVRNDWWPAECDERTKNTSAAFEDDAFKQALCKHENGRLKLQSSTKHEKSPVSSNSRDDHDKEEGRGKRKRRSKLHFDEMAISDNPVRKLRRLKIMRLLGLAAPVGSPFSHTHRSTS